MSSSVPSSAPSRGSSLRSLRACTCMFALAGILACTSAPEPPPTPRAVVRLSERYERLTASLDQATAQQIVDQGLPQAAVLEALAGLTFLRDVISDNSLSDAEDDLAIDVQGSLDVHARCPGWGRAGPAVDEDTGFVELTIGVDASRVQRAFTGRMSGCQFVAPRGSERAYVTASMTLELDLGHSVLPGEPLPALLMRAREVEMASDELDLAGAPEDFSLRVDEDDLGETLIELETLNIGQEGTFLLALREDGRLGLRGRDDEWVCGHHRSDPCVRAQ